MLDFLIGALVIAAILFGLTAWFAFCYGVVAFVVWDLTWIVDAPGGARFIFLLLSAVFGVMVASLANA